MNNAASNRGPIHWIFAGQAMSMLLFSAATGISYFFRSGGWHGLTAPRQTPQAMGFPLEIWRAGAIYNNAMIDMKSLLINVVFAIVIGVIASALMLWQSKRMNDFIRFMEAAERQNAKKANLQFSMTGMIGLTTAIAACLAIANAATSVRRELILGIYALGPAALIALSMFPKNLSWQQRAVLLTPSTILLIGYSLIIGNRLEMNFDHVLLGVFSCWVPQAVIGAAVITLWKGLLFSRAVK